VIVLANTSRLPEICFSSKNITIKDIPNKIPFDLRVLYSSLANNYDGDFKRIGIT